jgi:hypothetical protein
LNKNSALTNVTSNLSTTIFEFNPYFGAIKDGAKVMQVGIKPDRCRGEVKATPYGVGAKGIDAEPTVVFSSKNFGANQHNFGFFLCGTD